MQIQHIYTSYIRFLSLTELTSSSLLDSPDSWQRFYRQNRLPPLLIWVLVQVHEADVVNTSLSLIFPSERKTPSRPNFNPNRLAKISWALVPPCSQVILSCRTWLVRSFWCTYYKLVKRAVLTLMEKTFQILHGRMTIASHSLVQVSLPVFTHV